MSYKIVRNDDLWKVINSKTGQVVANHASKPLAKRHLKLLSNNIEDAAKIYNPAEHRQSGRFAPGQVTPGRQPTGRRGGGGQATPPARPLHPASHPINAWIPVRQEHHAASESDRRENATRQAALKDLAQAKEIEAQIRSLREQLVFNRQMIAFLNGTGPFPTARNPHVGAAGNVGSASVPGAQSGSAAQQQASQQVQQPFTAAQNASFASFLRGKDTALRQQIRALEDHANRLRDRGNDLLASIRGKSEGVPDIILTAGALVELRAQYLQ